MPTSTPETTTETTTDSTPPIHLQDYREGYQECPFCHRGNLRSWGGLEPSEDSQNTYQRYNKCYSCNTEWTDVYQLTQICQGGRFYNNTSSSNTEFPV